MSRHWTVEERDALAAMCAFYSAKGLSQQAIARHVGISQTSVYRLLREYSPTPTAEPLLPPPGPRVTIDMADVYDEVIPPRVHAYHHEERLSDV